MPTSTAGTSTDSRGFTLLELAVVVCLLGLFAALVVPRLAGVGEGSRRAALRKLAGTVRYLYNESVLTGREHRLIFDVDGGAWRARQLTPEGELVEAGSGGRGGRLPGGLRFADIEVAGKGKSSSGEVTAEFSPSGWVPQTVIHFDREGRPPLTLRILPLTGTTELHEGYREFGRVRE
jgi:general secretion pathway protein H